MARDLGKAGAIVHERAREVLRFWFDEVPARKRFARDDALDRACAERFGAMREDLIAAHGDGWRDTLESLFAAIILIDQLGRNIFRGEAKAFAADPLARALADEAIARGWPATMTPDQRQFLFMPFMHGETMADQARSLRLFAVDGGESYEFAQLHAGQIARFGRFPQRNAALGRTNTADEAAFLADPKNSF